MDGRKIGAELLVRKEKVLGTRVRAKRLAVVALATAGMALHPAGSTHAVEDPSIRLVVEARYQREDGRWAEFAVADGDVLRSGNGLRIRVDVLRPGYVLVALVGSSGKSFIVFPSSREQLERKAPAGGIVEIPPAGRFMILDDNTGQEAIFAWVAGEPVRNPVQLVADMDAAEGDVDGISRLLEQRFGEVYRIVFSHIADTPLVGVDPSLPLQVSDSDEVRESAKDPLGRPPVNSPRVPPEASFSVVPRAGVDEVNGVLSGEGSLIPKGLPFR